MKLGILDLLVQKLDTKILGGAGCSDEIEYYLSKGIRAERKKCHGQVFKICYIIH